MADENRTNAGRPLGASGPARQDTIDEQRRERNDMSGQSANQTNASDSSLGDRDETGSGRSAEEAAGRAPEPDHLGAAERAFEESRGVERRRENVSPADERARGGGGKSR